MISTVLLSWNRAELLARALRSFAETLDDGPYELIVVDNGSTDGARDVIEDSRRLIPGLDAVYHEENLGGEALNAAIARAKGELIQIHENDLVLLPGWRSHVAEAFAAFPGLGQLSLFNGLSSDEYPGEPQPGTLRFAHGKIVYEARSLGSSGIIPAELFRQHGIRVRNVPQEDPRAFKFPDDGRLSADIQASGRWCAWSDRRYVLNLGHHPEEFARDPDYYRRNYASKPWFGVAGWERRVAAARDEPRPRRRSTALPEAALQQERTPGSVAGKPARLWSMLDAVTPESEVLDVLHALVRAVKPRRALDASAWLGWSTVAIATALRDNGFGVVDALSGAHDVAETATANVAAAGLQEIVTMRAAEEKNGEPFEFAFFARRDAGELVRWYEALADGATLVFHGPAGDGADTTSLERLAADGVLDRVDFDVPRGLIVARLRKRHPGAPGPDSYDAWRSAYRQGDWNDAFRRGDCDFLDGAGEIPRYALTAGYVHRLSPDGDVLDAGCGSAVLARYLDCGRFRYTGFDRSPAAVERARSRLPGGNVFEAQIEAFEPPAGTRYAAIVFSESIQHTDEPLASLDRYRGFLLAEGVIVVTCFVPSADAKGARLARIIAAECEGGRYSLVDRAVAVSVSHALTWDLLVLR